MEVPERVQEQESEDVMAVGDISQGLRLDSRLCKVSTALVAGAQVRHKVRPRLGVEPLGQRFAHLSRYEALHALMRPLQAV